MHSRNLCCWAWMVTAVLLVCGPLVPCASAGLYDPCANGTATVTPGPVPTINYDLTFLNDSDQEEIFSCEIDNPLSSYYPAGLVVTGTWFDTTFTLSGSQTNPVVSEDSIYAMVSVFLDQSGPWGSAWIFPVWGTYPPPSPPWPECASGSCSFGTGSGAFTTTASDMSLVFDFVLTSNTTLEIQGDAYLVSPVPEPSFVTPLMILLVGGFAVVRRRKRAVP